MLNQDISNIISAELQVKPQQILSAIKLLDEGNTIPFIARYRKEVTEGLDDTQLRYFEDRLTYLRELADRKQTILDSIEQQGKLTLELQQKIQLCQQKNELEDLYLPYKPKRKTRGQKAIEAGLEPLAEMLWQSPELDPNIEAEKFINPTAEINTIKDALDGARYIMMERLAEDADLLAKVRAYLEKNAVVVAHCVAGQEEIGEKFKDYFAYQEPLHKIPSHRALALFRGRNEGVLNVSLTLALDEDEINPCEQIIYQYCAIKLAQQPADSWRKQVVSFTWKIKILLHLETELLGKLKEQAEHDAIEVFARNLKAVLMAPPVGSNVIMGLDPGLRTGVKVAIIDATGKLLTTTTIYPHTGQQTNATTTIIKLIQEYQVNLVAIGNGTASRETEKFILNCKQAIPNIKFEPVIVSEAGASVYSASELAANEFPQLDVSLRGAVSIARRLQDPLAELVKIEPKSIGVGQYQHDVNQLKLAKKLDAVVEDCVNAVGVELNTASVSLLARVAGLTNSLANNIVLYRETHGKFNNRQQLKEVSRLGAKAFEQCAGFLRINNGDNPLDQSAVHPEAYPLVEKILTTQQIKIQQLIGNSALLHSLDPNTYIDERFGLPTIKDILQELDKPGRDPRGSFKTAQFKEGIETINDLTNGLILEGMVTNVTNFGAFVDIGVHQDGLVHISMLSNKFVSDPNQVVKTGDIVQVKVIEVDAKRNRISLSMRLDEQASTVNNKDSTPATKHSTKKSQVNQANFSNNAFMDALKDWKK